MKKLLAIALCAVAAIFVSCNKDDDFDEILASIKNNQITLNGKTYDLGGYVSCDEKYCVVDLFSQGRDGGAHGIIEGPYLGKEVDLAKVNIEELILDLEVYSYGEKQEMSYGIRLEKTEGKVVSVTGTDLWDKEPTEGSCFKEGTLKATYSQSGKEEKFLLTLAGKTTDGKTVALKIDESLMREKY